MRHMDLHCYPNALQRACDKFPYVIFIRLSESSLGKCEGIRFDLLKGHSYQVVMSVNCNQALYDIRWSLLSSIYRGSQKFQGVGHEEEDSRKLCLLCTYLELILRA